MGVKVVNTNPHPVRVDKPHPISGAPSLQRIIAGQVVEAEGAFLDNLLATAGVESASKGAEDAWAEDVERGDVAGAMPGDASRLSAKMALGPQRVALRHATVAAPLRRVVGDSTAPVGPPSGVVTTKGEVVGDGSDEELTRAYAQNEALPGQSIEGVGEPDPLLPSSAVPTEPEIFNAQVANAEAAEEAARRWVNGGQDPAVEPKASGQVAVAECGPPYEPHNAKLLADEAGRRGLEVEGTGSKGNVTKVDLVAALEADDEPDPRGPLEDDDSS